MATNINYKTIISAAVVLIIAAVIFYLFNKNAPEKEDEQVAVTCSNKTVYRYKNPEQYFPSFTREYNNQVSVTTDFLKQLSDSAASFNIDLSTRNQIIQLQQQLNQDNITFSTGLRSYFMILNNDPCNDDIRMKYAQYTEEMTRRMLDLRMVFAQAAQIKEAAQTEVKDSAQSIPHNQDTVSTQHDNIVIKEPDTAKMNKSVHIISDVIRRTNIATKRLPIAASRINSISN